MSYRRYRRAMANYSSDLYLGAVYWLRIFLILWVSFLIIPMPAMLMPFKVLITQLKLTIPAVLLAAQHILLCFNTIRGNYVLVSGSTDSVKKDGIPKKEKQINKETLTRYIENRKPYLDPKLTIVDMAFALKTNRSYISAFINSTYGMNFSQFIDECRLSELDRIVADPGNADKSNIDKILMAGFGSYQSYRRAMKMQEERRRLKIGK